MMTLTTDQLAALLVIAIREGRYPMDGRYYYVWTDDANQIGIPDEHLRIYDAIDRCDLAQRLADAEGRRSRYVVKTRDSATIVYESRAAYVGEPCPLCFSPLPAPRSAPMNADCPNCVLVGKRLD